MMLRNFFFGSSSETKSEEEIPEIDDDQPRNKFKDIQILSGHHDLVDELINIGFSRVLSIGQDKRAIVWDCASGKILYELAGHSRVITCAFYLECFLNECSDILPAIVTASSDNIQLWDVSNGQSLKVIKDYHGTIKSFCLVCKDLRLVLSGGQDICIWTTSFRLLFTLQRNSLDYIHTLIILTSNQIIASTDQPQLITFMLLDDEEFSSFSEKKYEIKPFKRLTHHRQSVAHLVNINENSFASASMDGAIIIWNSHTLDITRQFNRYENFVNITDHTYPYKINHLEIADNRYILAGIGSGFAIYDALYDKYVSRVVQAHHSAVTCMALVSNGSYLVTSSLDGTAKLWAGPINETYEDLTFLQDIPSMSRLFGVRSLDVKTFPLKLDLVGMCCGHSNSVKSITSCGIEGFISCGSDGLVIFWRDSELIQKVKDYHLRKFLSDLGCYH